MKREAVKLRMRCVRCKLVEKMEKNLRKSKRSTVTKKDTEPKKEIKVVIGKKAADKRKIVKERGVGEVTAEEEENLLDYNETDE